MIICDHIADKFICNNEMRRPLKTWAVLTQLGYISNIDQLDEVHAKWPQTGTATEIVKL